MDTSFTTYKNIIILGAIISTVLLFILVTIGAFQIYGAISVSIGIIAMFITVFSLPAKKIPSIKNQCIFIPVFFGLVSTIVTYMTTHNLLFSLFAMCITTTMIASIFAAKI